MKKLLFLLTLSLVNCSPMQGGSGNGEGRSPFGNNNSSNNNYRGNYDSNRNDYDPSDQNNGGKKRYQPRDQGSGGSNQGEEYTFRIPEGTGDGSWNSEADTVELEVGDTLIIVNDDTVNHRLHTNGKPCEHGPDMAPGDSFRCELSTTYSIEADGPLYDHDRGDSARFWLRVSERDENGSSGEEISFAQVATVIEVSCGGSSCHSSGSPWPIYQDNESRVQGDAGKIIDRIQRDSGGEMPPITSGRVLSAENRELLIDYLNQ